MRALLMVPAIESGVDEFAYITMCMQKIIDYGHDPDVPALYRNTPARMSLKIDNYLSLCDMVYMFVNFGIDQVMLDVIDRAVKVGKPIRYERIHTVIMDQVFLTPREILRDVARKTGISVEMIQGKSRKREIIEARHIYCARAKRKTKASLARIGAEISRDHATVLHAVSNVAGIKELNKKYESLYGKTAIEKEAVEQQAASRVPYIPKIERPVLPYRTMDAGEQDIPSGKPFMCSLSGAGYHQPFNGYRSYNCKGFK